MKTHKTMTLTLDMLCKWRSCGDGRYAVRQLLPMKISTDPDDNIGIACALVRRDAGQYVDWLNDRCNEKCTSVDRVDDDYYTTTNRWDCERSPECDPMIIAQWLAHAADTYLTRKGR